LHPVGFASLQLLIVVIMMMEFFQLTCDGNNHLIQQILAIAAGLGLVLFTARAISAYVILPLPLLMFVVQIYKKDSLPFVVVGQHLLAIVYIALPVALWNYFVYPAGAVLVDFDTNFSPAFRPKNRGKVLPAACLVLWRPAI